MFKAIGSILAQLSAYASFLGLYLTAMPLGDPRPNWHWFIGGCGAVLALVMIALEFLDKSSFTTKKFSNERGIKNYMCKWISSPGRTVVFSRDLSWGTEEVTRKRLLEKARRSELTIFLENNTPLSDELKHAGADIQVYGQTGFVPESRFTIVGSDKQGARVAVGLLEDGKHVVYQFESGKHPIFSLAKDLTKLADKVGV